MNILSVYGIGCILSFIIYLMMFKITTYRLIQLGTIKVNSKFVLKQIKEIFCSTILSYLFIIVNVTIILLIIRWNWIKKRKDNPYGGLK